MPPDSVPSTERHSPPGSAAQPAHDNGVDVFAVMNDEGQVHCLHRSEAAADACAAWFGAEIQEWLIHD